MRICILGNSVGFKIRPPRRCPEERTYGEILRDAGHEVRNLSMAGALLSERFAWLDDEVITRFPDVVVLHQGVIEAFRRRTFRRPNNAAILNQYRNRVLRQGYVHPGTAVRLGHYILRGVNAVTRAGSRLSGLTWHWERRSRFVCVVQASVELILKETSARVLIVGITPPSTTVQADFPGLATEVGALNETLRLTAAGLGTRVAFLDVEGLFAHHAYDEISPDGIHFSALGHRMLAERLASMLGTTT